jgi:hypothetical protein
MAAAVEETKDNVVKVTTTVVDTVAKVERGALYLIAGFILGYAAHAIARFF